MSMIVFTKFHLKKLGGLEKYSLKIIDKYLQNNQTLTLLTTAVSQELLNKKKLEIVIIKIPKILTFFKIKLFDWKCKRWIKKNKPKIVFSLDRSSCYTHTRLGNGLHLTYLKRKKFFVSKLQRFLNLINPKNYLILNIEKKGFSQKNVKKIIVNSKMVQEELLEHYNIDPKKIEVIHNGVEFNDIKNDFDTWQVNKTKILKNLNLPLDTYHFIFIGNDYKRKGLIPLLKALSTIEKPFHLSILGKERKIKKFKNFAKRLKLDNKVTFFGKRDDIIKFYQFADALIIPTYYDPFSNVAIEALAMGVFVITSKYNGAKEIINSQNGKIIDMQDINGFSKHIENAMKTKKDQTLAKTIRQSVEHLDFSKQLDKLTKVIDV